MRDAIEDAWSAWEANAKASTDYVDVAEGYVTRTLAERMSARAKGVASVLSERRGLPHGGPARDRARRRKRGRRGRELVGRRHERLVAPARHLALGGESVRRA